MKELSTACRRLPLVEGSTCIFIAFYQSGEEKRSSTVEAQGPTETMALPQRESPGDKKFTFPPEEVTLRQLLRIYGKDKFSPTALLSCMQIFCTPLALSLCSIPEPEQWSEPSLALLLYPGPCFVPGLLHWRRVSRDLCGSPYGGSNPFLQCHQQQQLVTELKSLTSSRHACAKDVLLRTLLWEGCWPPLPSATQYPPLTWNSYFCSAGNRDKINQST